MKKLNESHIVIAGLVRNCEKNVINNINNLNQVFSVAKSVSFIVIESDSDDNTIEKLKELGGQIPFFSFISLGRLRNEIPKRTERIAHCRNYYLNIIESEDKFKKTDYVVISDLDNIAGFLSKDSIESCWLRTDWDVCTANQLGPYYDIWALRHPFWSPNDCWLQVKFLIDNGMDRYRAIVASVYSRMICIPINNDWIEVDSAFGGFAIYKRSILKDVYYLGIQDDGSETCEHVNFHKMIKSNSGKIYINPKLINAGLVEHARYSTSLGRLIFYIICKYKKLLKFLKNDR